MTDKQIIIDGVDVSGCKHYKNRTCIADYCLTDMPFGEAKCELNPNCYYKQLKRKEQECDQLKVENLSLKRGIEIAKEADKSWISQLKAENEILKEKFEIAIKNNMDKTLLRLENGDVKEELQEIREEFGIETLYCHDDNIRVHRCIKLLQLKDCLTEIKEIAERVKGYDPLAKQIIQKISECEGNDELTK